MRWIVYSLILINIAVPAYFLIVEPAEPRSAVAYPPAERGAELVLIGEGDSGKKPTTSLPPGTKLCYALGPYIDDLNARVAQARAKELSLTGIVSPVEVPLGDDREFWVHIPPLDSRASAMNELRRLQQKNIDSYIITQGDLAEGISLGLFHRRESAEGLAGKIRNAGFDVAVREIAKSRTEYWLEVREITRLDDRNRQRIKAGDAGVDWQMIGCKHQSNR